MFLRVFVLFLSCGLACHAFGSQTTATVPVASAPIQQQVAQTADWDSPFAGGGVDPLREAAINPKTIPQQVAPPPSSGDAFHSMDDQASFLTRSAAAQRTPFIPGIASPLYDQQPKQVFRPEERQSGVNVVHYSYDSATGNSVRHKSLPNQGSPFGDDGGATAQAASLQSTGALAPPQAKEQVNAESMRFAEMFHHGPSSPSMPNLLGQQEEDPIALANVGGVLSSNIDPFGNPIERDDQADIQDDKPIQQDGIFRFQQLGSNRHHSPTPIGHTTPHLFSTISSGAPRIAREHADLGRIGGAPSSLLSRNGYITRHSVIPQHNEVHHLTPEAFAMRFSQPAADDQVADHLKASDDNPSKSTPGPGGLPPSGNVEDLLGVPDLVQQAYQQVTDSREKDGLPNFREKPKFQHFGPFDGTTGDDSIMPAANPSPAKRGKKGSMRFMETSATHAPLPHHTAAELPKSPHILDARTVSAHLNLPPAPAPPPPLPSRHDHGRPPVPRALIQTDQDLVNNDQADNQDKKQSNEQSPHSDLFRFREEEHVTPIPKKSIPIMASEVVKEHARNHGLYDEDESESDEDSEEESFSDDETYDKLTMLAQLAPVLTELLGESHHKHHHHHPHESSSSDDEMRFRQASTHHHQFRGSSQDAPVTMPPLRALNRDVMAKQAQEQHEKVLKAARGDTRF